MSIARPLRLTLVTFLSACGTQESILTPKPALNGEVGTFNNASIAADDANVIYDEQVDGDLLGPLETSLPTVDGPYGVRSTPLSGMRWASGTLGHTERPRLRLGANVIRGTTFVAGEKVGTNCVRCVDIDAFTVDVPNGMELRLDETTYGFHSLASSGDGRITDIDVVPTIMSPHFAKADQEVFLATLNSSVVIDGAVTASPLRTGFYNVTNFSVDPNHPVRRLPAGTYRFFFGMTWSHYGQTKTAWNYEFTLVMAPTL